jgi:pimeloyl-ACP methyl ester carboxylesterase
MTQSNQAHVTEWGDGPRSVLVHGGTPGGGQFAFHAQQELAKYWHLVLPDRPGHGETSRQGREDFERDAELLAPLLDDQSHLVGHSYGGVVALYMAVMRPEAVASLTLIEPPAFCFAAGNPAADEMARANRELFENPPADTAELMRTFFRLVGIDIQIPDPPPAGMLDFAPDFSDIRGPDEAVLNAADLTAGGYPILVMTSGRIAGFEAIAEAIAEQTDSAHLVIPNTDHLVQNAGRSVNRLLDILWSSAATLRGRVQ